MNNISHNTDFIEVPRTKHIKKRLIKSRVLSRLLFALSRGEICHSYTPFSEIQAVFLRTLSAVQLSELSCILISDLSIDFFVGPESSDGTFETSETLGRLIAKFYIAEWVLDCSNDYRFIYDEQYKGTSTTVLSKLSQSTPLELQDYEEFLVATGLIQFEVHKDFINRSIENAKRLFRQDTLIINAIKHGASLPQAKQFFFNHRLCDSRSVAVLKKLFDCRQSSKSVDPDICEVILFEFAEVSKSYALDSFENEEFLSKLYNLLSSVFERFDVGFFDCWNAIRNSTNSDMKRIQTR